LYDDEYSQGSGEAGNDPQSLDPFQDDPFQDVSWNQSDVFPSDDALCMHFVARNPGVEDLEEIIKDDILGDMFEGIKKKAKKDIKKAAGFCGVEPDLLQEIIDAK
jgi:hypothetical protein